jgi:methylmalonyl-CoA mutase N-terminal domain/subunit
LQAEQSNLFYAHFEVARSAHKFQHQLEAGERIIVGVNKFVDDMEVSVGRTNPQGMYDPEKRAQAEEKQLANLAKLKRERDNQAVEALKRLKEAAADESVNLIPPLVETVKTYATLGEITNTLKEVFGERQKYAL